MKKELIELANLIFPNIKKTIKDLEKKYPPRKLAKDSEVTRFAPSPTGYLHTGSLFASLISWRIAKQSQGVFYIRLEDTDTKREIKGTGDIVIEQLKDFNIIPDASFLKPDKYGPYIQSERKEIYNTVLKELTIHDKAYPCFVTIDELAEIRKKQEEQKLTPGYYKEFARDRFLSPSEAIEKIKQKIPYVIRFKSHGDENKKIPVKDLIKGDLELPENIQDIVIMKQDGLPTYHFAHAVDDHFMHTTVITRGEEWLSSLPIHIQLFDELGFARPKYAHLPVIMKIDEGQRRKLSKRKDPEAAVSYFLEKGYPEEAFITYLLTIANSNFEEWLIQNKDKSIFDFKLSFDKMSLDGALFDIEKVNYFSKEYLGNLDTNEFFKKALAYAKLYNPELEAFINKDQKYFKEIISIERGGEKPRKDYASFSEIIPLIDFMDDEIFNSLNSNEFPYKEGVSKEDIKSLLTKYLDKLDLLDTTEDNWFTNFKELAISLGYAGNNKEYKQNPIAFKGTIGDAAEILRISLTGKKSTPNFFLIQKIMGKERITKRINKIIQ